MRKEIVLAMLPVAVLLSTGGAAVPAEQHCVPLAHQPADANAMRLFSAVSACHESGSELDAAAILLAGQERALTDLALLPPDDEAAERQAAELYQFVYFKAGGFGYEDILQSEASLTALFQMLEAWQPAYSKSYDPGWDVRRYPSVEKYLAQLRYSTKVRRIQLEHVGLLKRDPEYRKLDRERQKLLRARNNVITDPADNEKYTELTQKLHEIAAKYPAPEMPELPEILRFEYTPDPDASFRQLLSGVDGPDTSRVEVFESWNDIQDSWLAKKLDAEELGKIASSVNFDSEVVMAISVGERTNSSSRAFVTGARYSEKTGEVRSAIMVGVYPEKCDVPSSSRFPFVLVAVAREQERIGRSSSIANFPDACPR